VIATVPAGDRNVDTGGCSSPRAALGDELRPVTSELGPGRESIRGEEMSGKGSGPTGAKASFDDLYVQPDPRAYYRGLGALGYEVPRHGQRVFDGVLDTLDADEPTVVDLCCSYGVNAALLKHDLELDELEGHYRSEQLAAVSTGALADIDRAYFEETRRDQAPRVIGVDTAAPAVEYAVDVGLLDAGFAENLEVADPSPELRDHAARADLITVTGGVGYITDQTFDRLLDCSTDGHRPWVASLCLRTVSYQPVAECLARHGLVTERLDDVTFPQRRFASAEEQRFARRTRISARGPPGRAGP
jgi:hypothetical protein